MRARWLMAWGALAVADCRAELRTRWRDAFSAYVQTHPAAGPADLYKLAHQGIMGSEHAVRDTAAVHRWMTSELAALPARATPSADRAPLVEALPPDGRFVRVHLRPLLAQRGSPDALVQAFIATANGASGDPAQFSCAIEGLEGLGARAAAARTFFEARRDDGYPAVHHSPAYEASDAPAYRVIDAARVPAVLSHKR